MWIHKILPSYIMSFTLSGKTWWDNDIHKKRTKTTRTKCKSKTWHIYFFLQYWDASSLSFLNCHLLSCLESSLESNDKKLYFSCILNVSGASYFDWIFKCFYVKFLPSLINQCLNFLPKVLKFAEYSGKYLIHTCFLWNTKEQK